MGWYWQPGALVWDRPCRVSNALFGTSVDPGTQNEAQPLTWFSHRPEPPHEEVRDRTRRGYSQIQCDFSLFDVFPLVVVQSKCSNCTFCSQNATRVSDWSVRCDWQEEDCLFCPKPKDVQLIIPRSINGLPINQIPKWLLVRILEKLRVQDVRGAWVEIFCNLFGKRDLSLKTRAWSGFEQVQRQVSLTFVFIKQQRWDQGIVLQVTGKSHVMSLVLNF